jgi:hypothetical protein
MSTRDVAHGLAQLRHLYALMVTGDLGDPADAARGLLGPAITKLESAGIDGANAHDYLAEMKRLGVPSDHTVWTGKNALP